MSDERKVRLACRECDTTDFDGITKQELAELIAKGEWQDIEEHRSLEEAIRTYEPGEPEPPGWSAFYWYTHLGLCPECVAEEVDVES